MPARKCFKCGDSYPASKQSEVRCPECGAVLQYVTDRDPDTDWPPEIAAVLPTLDSETEWKIALSWKAVEDEARRRGPMWSIADILAEGWRAEPA